MNWNKYKEELELITKQNDSLECDLYYPVTDLINNIIDINKKDISVRTVSERRRTGSHKEKIFWGIHGFPDLILTDKDFSLENSSKNFLLGAVEMKYIGKEFLSDPKDSRQLKGFLMWFGNVIHTNGLEWRFFYKK